MTEREYNAAIANAKMSYEKNCISIWGEFAMSNNKVKVGDLLEYYAGTIRVEQITFSRPVGGVQYPFCVYIGKAITKKGTAHKVLTRDIFIYQSQIKNHIQNESK